MVTRKQSLNNFSTRMDDLINCAYLLSAPKITAVLKSITSSHLFFELVTFCMEDVDFDELFVQYSLSAEPYPVDDKKTLIAFGFNLLALIDSGEIELYDVISNNYKRSTLDKCYSNFAAAFLIPFKTAVIDTVEKMIDLSRAEETSADAPAAGDKKDDDVSPVFARADDDGEGRKNYLTCYSDIQTIVTEERVKIMYAKLREGERQDLVMLLDAFRDCLFKGTKEQIKQAFISYKYAVQNFKKLDTAVDDIGRILKFCGIIS